MIDRFDSLKATSMETADSGIPEAAVSSHPLGIDGIIRADVLRRLGE
jgi:hypothetical protein